MYSHVLAIDLMRLSQSPCWRGLDLVSYLVSYICSFSGHFETYRHPGTNR